MSASRTPAGSRRYRRLVEVKPVGEDAPAFQREVLSLLPLFWDQRDVRHLHHPVWFRQFGEAALAARSEAGSLCGYLLGAPTPVGGYAHVVATLPAMRGRRVGRALYARFATEVMARGRATVEAITVPTNTGSVAFHERLGFTVTVAKDYAGPDEDRVLMQADVKTLLEGFKPVD